MEYSFNKNNLKSASRMLNRLAPRITTDSFSAEVYWCRVAVEENWNSMPHRHSFYEVHMPVSGRATLNCSGSVIEIGVGNYCLINSCTQHNFLSATDDYGEFVFGFGVENNELAQRITDKAGGFFFGTANGYMLAAVDQMLKNAINAQFAFLESIEHQLACICIEMFQQIIGASGKAGAPVTNDMRIRIALKYIEDNISASITGKDVAECVHVSLRHLNRLCEDALLMSVARLILTEKIRFAKRLMSDMAKSLQEISEAVGFSSQQQFSKAFKRVEGVTPMQYRRDLIK